MGAYITLTHGRMITIVPPKLLQLYEQHYAEIALEFGTE